MSSFSILFVSIPSINKNFQKLHGSIHYKYTNDFQKNMKHHIKRMSIRQLLDQNGEKLILKNIFNICLEKKMQSKLALFLIIVLFLMLTLLLNAEYSLWFREHFFLNNLV